MLWSLLKRIWLTVRWKCPERCDMCNDPGFRGEHLGPISGDFWVCEKCWDKVHKECANVK